MAELPPRYFMTIELAEHVVRRAQQLVEPGAVVLDVGGGRSPTLGVDARAERCTYVGLDSDGGELALAGLDYDEVVVAPAERLAPELVGRFDLALSTHTFEHVRSLRAVTQNLHRYLAPGGTLLALFSGTFAPHAIANRLIPHAAARLIAGAVTHRPAATVFPARYDSCYASRLRVVFRSWRSFELTPLYVGAHYLASAPALQRAYLAYEEWAMQTGRENLASHYFVEARA